MSPHVLSGRPARRGAAAVLYVAALAFAVMGVLAFSQAYTETTTLSVARSMAARHAALALDSALDEAYAKLVARVNDAADAEMTAMRSHELDAAPWQVDVPLEATPAAFGITVEPVKAQLLRLKSYADTSELPQYRFGLLELTARVRVPIPGSNQTVGRQGSRVHELKQSPAIPPNPFYSRPLWIKDFSVYLNRKRNDYQEQVDLIDRDASDISRRTRVQLTAFVSQMQRAQMLVDDFLRDRPGMANPRWGEVQAASPQTQVWEGVGVAANSFPLPMPDWPLWPQPVAPPAVGEFHYDNPVYFVTPEGEVTRDSLKLELPPREDLNAEPDPIGQFGFARRAGGIRVSLFDWPGSSAGIQQADGTHFPPGGAFTRLTGPYRAYHEALRERLRAAREAYAQVIDPYNQRIKIVKDTRRPTFEDEWWPYVTAAFTKRRAAFVYPDPEAFRSAHQGGAFTVFGVEFLDSDSDLDLSGVLQARGPGTLGARHRLVVGPLSRDGDRPLTLIAGESLQASGRIHASVICPRVSSNPGVSDAQVQGTFTVERLDPDTCGGFTVRKDPLLETLDLTDRSDGVVVNVAPAPAAEFGARE